MSKLTDLISSLTTIFQDLTGKTAGSKATDIGNAISTYAMTNPMTAQGDIIYGGASGLETKLIKGLANTHLLINSGATAPEWVVPYKIGSLTRDTSLISGDVAYTGVGFKPSVIIFIIAGNYFGGVGYDDATTHYNVSYSTAWDTAASYSIRIGVSGSAYQIAIIKSMDADGFTLTWTKTGGPTGTQTIRYLALR